MKNIIKKIFCGVFLFILLTENVFASGEPTYLKGIITVTKDWQYFGHVVKHESTNKSAVHFSTGYGRAEYYNVQYQSKIIDVYVDVSMPKPVKPHKENMPATYVDAETTINKGLYVRMGYQLNNVDDKFDGLDADEAYITYYFY